MLDSVLTDCSSAAICRKAAKLQIYYREGSISIAILPTSASNVVVPSFIKFLPEVLEEKD
jgi:hypothetical protein